MFVAAAARIVQEGGWQKQKTQGKDAKGRKACLLLLRALCRNIVLLPTLFLGSDQSRSYPDVTIVPGRCVKQMFEHLFQIWQLRRKW
jgi:hypothetical protein